MSDLKQKAAERITEAQSGWMDFGTHSGIDLKPYILCSTLFWVMRVISKPNDTFRMHLYDLFFSVPLGTLAGAIMMEAYHQSFLSMGVCSMASLLARDWVTSLLNTGWGKKLDEFLDRMLINLSDRFKKE